MKDLETRIRVLWAACELSIPQIQKELSFKGTEVWEKIIHKMYSKTEIKNHTKKLISKSNRKKSTRFVSGYELTDMPQNWKGSSYNGLAFTHQVVYCISNNLDQVPKGFNIHHIDLNKLNNDISNLEMMTITEHSRLHRKLEKETPEDLMNLVDLKEINRLWLEARLNMSEMKKAVSFQRDYETFQRLIHSMYSTSEILDRRGKLISNKRYLRSNTSNTKFNNKL